MGHILEGTFVSKHIFELKDDGPGDQGFQLPAQMHLNVPRPRSPVRRAALTLALL